VLLDITYCLPAELIPVSKHASVMILHSTIFVYLAAEKPRLFLNQKKKAQQSSFK